MSETTDYYTCFKISDDWSVKWCFYNNTRLAEEYTKLQTQIFNSPELQSFTENRPGPSYRLVDRKSTRLNSSHIPLSRMPSSA